MIFVLQIIEVLAYPFKLTDTYVKAKTKMFWKQLYQKEKPVVPILNSI